MSNGEFPENTNLSDAAGNLAKPSAATLTSAGSLLRRYRTDRGVDLYQLAAVLKVRPEKLDALENDRYDELPDMVFTRALALSICRIFQTDSAPVLALFPEASAPHLSRDSDGLNQPFRSSGMTSGSVPLQGGRRTSKIAVAVVALLLASAAGIYFWPQANTQDTAGDANTSSTTTLFNTGPGSSVSETTTNLSASQPQFPAPLQPSLPTAEPSEAESVADTANTEPVASSAPAVEEEAPAPAATLHITAKESVWLQIRDGKNALVRQTTLSKGQDLTIDQPPPLKVEIGRVDAVDIQVKGEAFDLKPFARNNVARFEIAP